MTTTNERVEGGFKEGFFILCSLDERGVGGRHVGNKDGA
jgi:hypothetical protein